MRTRRSLLTLLSIAMLAVAADAAPATPRVPLTRRAYETQKIEGAPPVIDGNLSDSAWTQGVWAGDFVQREPRQGAKASYPTEVKVLYDDRNVYVAIRAFDPEVASRPRVLGSRDEFAGDMVGISLDSFHNRKNSFEFDVTSGGSKVDLVLDNLGTADTSWNAVWDCKVGYESDAWVAEFRIPLSQLRYATGSDLTWGMHCWRWINALQEESNWSLIPMDNPGFIYSFGELKGLKSLPRHRHIELAPYSVLSYKTRAPEADNPLVRPRESELAFGADLKYGLTSNLTLDLTLNPDFGQVEADPSEINLSTVEVFQKERRPYFLEGNSVFDFNFGEDLVYYSRRIGASPRLTLDGFAHVLSPEASRILGSVKITGRTEGGLALGLMAASTEKTYANTFDKGELGRKLVDPQTQYISGRVQQDLKGGDWVLGCAFTAVKRSADGDTVDRLPSSALVGGVDVLHYWNDRAYFATVRLAFSRLTGTQAAIRSREDESVHNFSRVDGAHADGPRTDTELSGHAGTVSAGKGNGGNWRYQGFVNWRSPGVDFNDAGYLARADVLEPGAQLEYFDSSHGHFFKRRDHRLTVKETDNYAGMRLNHNANFRNELATTSNYFMLANFGTVWDRLDSRDLRGGPALVKPVSFPMWFYMEGDGGKRLQPKMDFSASVARDGSEKSLHIGPGLVFRPSPRWRAEFGVEWDRDLNDHQYAASPTIGNTPAWIVGKMSQNTIAGTLRLSYQFSPDLSIAYFGGPFSSSGRFSDYQRVVSPRASDPEVRFRPITARSLDGGMEGNDAGTNFTFDRPDFDWRELKSNLVVRWEYRPGSSIYVVWSQHRSDTEDLGDFDAPGQMRRIFSDHPENTLLIKASYWFSI